MATQAVNRISLEESKKRRELVNYSTRMIQSEGLPLTAEMRQMDELYVSGEIDDQEYSRRSRRP
jgi:hypothetical protein